MLTSPVLLRASRAMPAVQHDQGLPCSKAGLQTAPFLSVCTSGFMLTSPMPLRTLFQVLGRDLVMVPKLIHPLPPNEPRTPRSGGEEEDIEEEPPTPHPLNDTWMQVQNLTCCCISSRVSGCRT